MNREVEDNVSDFLNILGEDDNIDPKKEEGNDQEDTKEEEETIPPAEGEDETEDSDEDLKDDSKSEEEEEGEIDILDKQDVSFAKVKEKYPELFKDFPKLRDQYFASREYKKIFSTVEEAQTAAEDIESLRTLEQSILRSSEEDVSGVLKSFEGLKEGTVERFAESFLPSLKNLNQDVYYKVITQPLVDFTRSLYDSGLRNENENLRNAALVAAHYFFGDQKVATGEKKIEVPKKAEVKKDDTLDNERKALMTERYTMLYNDISQDITSKINSLIMTGIDPKNSIPEGAKELIAEKVAKEIGNTLSKSSSHKKAMSTLWKKAKDDKFSSGNRKRIVDAYIQAATEVMPGIRSSIKAKVLGLRERHPSPNGRRSEDRIEPQQSSSGGKGRKPTVTPKNVDWSKTSDLDLLNDNVTFKGN